VMKHPKYYGCPTGDCPHWQQAECDVAMQQNAVPDCPYGKPGDLLWVRETIEKALGYGGIGYPADGTWYPDSAWEWKRNTVPSIHMPRRLSRLTLETTGVRVERLQDISEADAVAEGATSRPNCSGFGNSAPGWSMDWSDVGSPSRFCMDGILTERDVCLGSARMAFGAFINELHGGKCWNRNGSQPLWDANPWVWVLSFRVHRQNVDELLKARAA